MAESFILNSESETFGFRFEGFWGELKSNPPTHQTAFYNELRSGCFQAYFTEGHGRAGAIPADTAGEDEWMVT